MHGRCRSACLMPGENAYENNYHAAHISALDRLFQLDTSADYLFLDNVQF